MILDEIVARKRADVAARRRATPIPALRDRPLYAEPRRGFRATLAARPAPAVIAEMKRASPSRKRIREAYDPAILARSYTAGGADALSVLTDTPYFEGALGHLVAARAATALPCLEKDFVVDPYQIEEARAYGADAILLIVAVVRDAGRDLLAAAAEAGLDALVEVHTADELAWARDAGATLVGINNRDLQTFDVRLETTERLAPAAPPGAVLVAESGVRTAADALRMRAAGAQAILVGEAFMAHDDPGALLAAWRAEWARCP
jgi:indole-3-glycerol phosphate synthase